MIELMKMQKKDIYLFDWAKNNISSFFQHNLMLNKFIPILIFLICNLTSYSQNIGINYNSTGAGRNITATYSKDISHYTISIGIGYNINSIRQPDDQSNIYYKRLYATKPAHYLNFNLSYQHDIFYNLKNIKPFVFYDSQIKYSTTRSSMYIPYDYDTTYLNTTRPEDGILYKNYIEYFGPFTWVENSIGVGFKVDITDRLYLQQRIGAGIHLIFGDEPKLLKYNSMEWEFMGLLNVGIVYRLKEKSL
ncbi:MAG: hypothetical protein K9J27_05945 [Bacteroidales bacterium]|nr:hypothetical protein [Bacteroidales bacterium]